MDTIKVTGMRIYNVDENFQNTTIGGYFDGLETKCFIPSKQSQCSGWQLL